MSIDVLKVLVVTFRWVILFLALVCTGMWVRFALRKPLLRYLAIAVIGWCLHVSLFGLIVFIGTFPPIVMNLWSSIIRIHALVLLMTGAITMAEKDNG